MKIKLYFLIIEINCLILKIEIIECTNFLSCFKIYDYDPIGNLVNIKDKSTGNILERYTYYPYNLLPKTKTTGDKTVTTYYYDYLNQNIGYDVKAVNSDTILYKEENKRETTTNTVYPNYDKISKTINGISASVQYYDEFGNLVESTENKRTIKYTYDLLGNLIKKYYTDKDASEDFTVDAKGNILTSKDRAGNTTKYSYDLLGRSTIITDPRGGKTKYEYDNNNRIKSEKHSFDTVESYAETKYEYDNNSNVTKKSVKNNSVSYNVTSYSVTDNTYDARNNLIKTSVMVNSNNDCYTEYEYDKVGNMTKVKSANGQNVTSYNYDSLNRVTKMIDPMNMTENYTYDLSGNMIKKVDRNGKDLRYNYDALNRLTKEYTIVGGSEVIKSAISYAFSNNYLVKTETNQNDKHTITTSYNVYNNPIEQKIKQDEKYFKINFAYHSGGLLSYKFIYETNSYYDTKNKLGDYYYNYDKMDRLTSFDEYNQSEYKYEPIVQYGYDENSNIDHINYNNNTQASYKYNYANLVTSMSNKKGNTVLSSYDYTYYYDGNQYTKTDHTGRVVDYCYDNLGRLTIEDVSGTADREYITYKYDAAGNRTQKIINNRIGTLYTYDKNNRLLSEFHVGIGLGYKEFTNYDYDNNGNMKLKTSSHYDKPINVSEDASLNILTKDEFAKDDNHMIEYYKYNDFNQLVGYSNNKGTKASYEYLPNGLRSSKTVGGIKTEQVWDGQNLFLEIDSNGNIASQYEYGLDMIRNKNTNTYYNYDAHGDVVQLTDANGTVKADYTYDAFGNQKTSTNVTNPFRYCGEYYDNESGLIYLRNRYYNPSTGRFINEDPIRSGGNWYSYCHSDPVNFYDRLGLSDSSHYIEVPEVRQRNENDCWAATLTMVIGYYTHMSSIETLEELECEVVNKVEDRKDDNTVNNENISDADISPKFWEDVNNGMGVETVNPGDYEDGLSPRQYSGYDEAWAMEKQRLSVGGLKYFIKSAIDAGNPVVLFYNDNSLGHFVLVTGYEMKSSNMTVTYNDPGVAEGESVVKTANIDDMSSQLPDTSFNFNSVYSKSKVMERIEP